MTEDKWISVDILNVECPGIYQIEFEKRWEFLFRLPPMLIKDLQNIVDDLQEKIHEINDSLGETKND